MNIQKFQGINFKGKVVMINPEDAKNPLLRPLIHYLKHSAGSNKVGHYVDLEQDILFVSSAYYPFVRFKKIAVAPGESITKEHIKKMIDWAKDTKTWFQDIRFKEKGLNLNL